MHVLKILDKFEFFSVEMQVVFFFLRRMHQMCVASLSLVEFVLWVNMADCIHGGLNGCCSVW